MFEYKCKPLFTLRRNPYSATFELSISFPAVGNEFKNEACVFNLKRPSANRLERVPVSRAAKA